MYQGLLHLHSFLRWIILILILAAIIQSIGAKKYGGGKALLRTSLFLLISAHIQFLIGLYQWFMGEYGLKLIRNAGMSAVMKDKGARFWAIEHIFGMFVAIALITIARGKVKKGIYGAATWLYIIALLLILASVPWPFRAGVGRPWFPGMDL